MAALTFNPDLEQARAYLRVLGEPVTFQTFSDYEELKLIRNGNPYDPNALILHGTLEQHAATLTRLNNRHAGIYVMVNAGDGKGRSTKNVTRVRAVFTDFDGAPLPEQWELEPHLLVESSQGKYHAYWLVADLPMGEFRAVQKSLAAHYGSDSSVCDLCRVMRLPGFYHYKSEPVMVRLLKTCDHPPLIRADLLTAHPAIAEALRPKVTSTTAIPSNYRPSIDTAERILMTALQRYSATGTRHEGAKWLACQCWWNNVPRDDAERLAQRYAEEVHEPFDTSEALELVEWAYTMQPPGEPWHRRFNERLWSLNKSPWLSQNRDLTNSSTPAPGWGIKSPWGVDRAH